MHVLFAFLIYVLLGYQFYIVLQRFLVLGCNLAAAFMFAGIEEKIIANASGECEFTCMLTRYFIAPVFLTVWGMFAAVSATCSCVQGDCVPTLLRSCFEKIGSCCLFFQVLYSGLCIVIGWKFANDAKDLGYGSGGATGLISSMGIATSLNWIDDFPIGLLSYSWKRYKEQNKMETERRELRANDGDADFEHAPEQIAISRV